MVIRLQREGQEYGLQGTKKHQRVTLRLIYCLTRIDGLLKAYLMVSHADIRTNCVVKNTLPIIISLRQTENEHNLIFVN